MRAKNLIIPGIIISILFLYLFTSLISTPKVVGVSNTNPTLIPPPDTGNSRQGISPNFSNSIQQWKEIIEHSAINLNLDANLIASVILQESGGDPQAYSSSGAVGLMQVMPRDGLAAGFICDGIPCFQSRPSMQELYDPHFNIEYGSRMLNGLINKYGDWREALRVYGPMDVGYEYADLVLLIKNNVQNENNF
jgi:soluble lytic murein transglycosylase-like protein